LNTLVEPRAFAAPLAPAANATLAVREMQRGDIARWDAFVTACPEATFCHRAGWKEAIERAFGHRTWFLFAENQGRIEGVLPLAEVKSLLFGHSLVSLPFCVYGGIAASTEAARQALHREAQALAARLKVGHLEYRNLEAKQPDWLGKELYVTFRKEIYASDDDNMRAITSKRRAMVRKGIKAGLQSEIDSGIDRFYDAYAKSVHHLGTPVFSKNYFRILREVFPHDSEIMTITLDGRTISSVMNFYFRDHVMAYYWGGAGEAREVAGNDFMCWEVMRRAGKRGIRTFDFGRSKIGTGSYDFKKGWGFEPQHLPYAYQLHRAKALPDNNPLNPKYQRFIKMWQRLPLQVANAIGPHIVKNLG